MSVSMTAPRSRDARASHFRRLAVAVAGVLAMAGCAMVDRLAAVGSTPELAPIENPTRKPDYRPVSMPMPLPEMPRFEYNSRWRAGARTFFKDQRANRVGDILTFLFQIDEVAYVDNSSTRNRYICEGSSFGAFFG